MPGHFPITGAGLDGGNDAVCDRLVDVGSNCSVHFPRPLFHAKQRLAMLPGAA
jgi:hypothetical protein